MVVERLIKIILEILSSFWRVGRASPTLESNGRSSRNGLERVEVQMLHQRTRVLVRLWNSDSIASTEVEVKSGKQLEDGRST